MGPLILKCRNICPQLILFFLLLAQSDDAPVLTRTLKECRLRLCRWNIMKWSLNQQLTSICCCLIYKYNDLWRKHRQVPKMTAENRECHFSRFICAGAIAASENNVSRQEASRHVLSTSLLPRLLPFPLLPLVSCTDLSDQTLSLMLPTRVHVRISQQQQLCSKVTA